MNWLKTNYWITLRFASRCKKGIQWNLFWRGWSQGTKDRLCIETLSGDVRDAVKVSHCIQLSFEGVAMHLIVLEWHYSLWPASRWTINSKRYCEQLEDLKKVVLKKRPELRRNVVFQMDNARPHVALATKQKLKGFSWGVTQHPPYSPDIAPSDFHLFRSLQNHLDLQRYNSTDEIVKIIRNLLIH